MKRLSENEMVDLMDGVEVNQPTLRARVEAYPEDAAHLETMLSAREMLLEACAADPVRVSENFWPALRDKLPEQPRRSLLSAVWARLQEAAWPSYSRTGRSFRVAMVAAVLAVCALWFAPQKAIETSSADEQTFIQQSLQRHQQYVTSQPPAPVLPIPAGDGTTADRGDDDDNSGPPTP